jgi:DNA-binding MarR family transcriptional regulator
MKDLLSTAASGRTRSGAASSEAEATLAAFLDVADQLYERVGDALARVGLSYPKYEVLDHLREAGGPVSLGDLAEGQSCARSNITQLVDKLEVEGLVRRIADREDRRSILAELTEDGAARAVEGRTQLDLVKAEFAASFSAPERTELGRLLSRLL